jgi:uncharacterized protein involved in exopolysaccharide biosynthesis
MEMVDGQPHGWEEGPDLLQSAWRFKWLIAAVALSGALLGYGWAARQPTLYQGVSEVLLSGGVGPQLSGGAVEAGGDPERFLQNQAVLITRTPVLERAARRIEGRATPAELAAGLSVEVEQDVDLITISVLDENPENAALFANAVALAYKDFVEGQPGQQAAQLRSRRDLLEKELAGIQTQLAAAPGSGSLQRRRDAMVETLNQIEKDLAAAVGRIGGDLVRVERAVVPEQPALPATRRTTAVGLLLGVVAGIALAWWLNARRSAQVGRTVWQGSGPTQALPGRSAGPGAPSGQLKAGVPGAVRPAGGEVKARQNGGLRASTVPRLMQRLRGERPLAQAVPDATTPDNGEATTLTGLLARIDWALTNQPLDFYSEAIPQALAEEIPNDIPADLVAVLLDDGSGTNEFRVLGGVGLAADEQDAVVDQDHAVLRQALWDGVTVFHDANELRADAADIPGSNSADAMIMLPLVQGTSWLGMILIGRRSNNGDHAALFSDEEIERALVCGMEAACIVQSLALAKQLRRCISAAEPFGGQGTG